jgi:flagellar L-ring protein precursor FlgH
MLNLKSNGSDAGAGKVDRKETVQTTIAVTVIKVLSSGNLVIKGTQEVRVNFDVREITIEGIVRPEDISMDNKVKLEQIAEARVSYGGRGQIFEYQQAPYGKQVLDIVSPF